MTDTDLKLWDQKRSRELSSNMHRNLCLELRSMIYDNFAQMLEGNCTWDVDMLPEGILSLDENRAEPKPEYQGKAFPSSQKDIDRLRASAKPYELIQDFDGELDWKRHPVQFTLDNHQLFNHKHNVYWHERHVGADVAREFAAHWYRTSTFVIRHTTALATFLEQDLFSGCNTGGRFFPASKNPEGHRLIPRQHMTSIRVHIYEVEWADPESLEGLSQRLRQLAGLRESALITIVFVVEPHGRGTDRRRFAVEHQVCILRFMSGRHFHYRSPAHVQAVQYARSMMRNKGRAGLILLAPVWRELKASRKRLRFII